MSDRDQYIKALRVTATLLETVPDLPPPSLSPHSCELLWNVSSREPDPGAELARLARLMPCKLTKNQPGLGREFDDKYYELAGQIDGVEIRIWAVREEVCRKVVTGTKPVTRLVPDPTVEVPLVSVTEMVETYEWRCDPLLTKTPASHAAAPDRSPGAAVTPRTAAPGEREAVAP